VPVFQPIVSMANGEVVAYEALSRPFVASGAAVPVERVLAAAERTGAAPDFDAMAIAAIAPRAARDLPTGADLFVNVSPATLLTSAAALGPLDPFASRVVLEVTERIHVGPEDDTALARALEPLRAKGYRVAVDDCGAGYSGLSRLLELRPEYAKIDISLVRHVDTDGAKEVLVEALARFAYRSGAVLVAEGVESAAEREALFELGVDLAQGYHFARPADAFVAPPPRPLRTSLRPRAGADAAFGTAQPLLTFVRGALHDSGDRGGRLYAAAVVALRRTLQADMYCIRRLAGGRLEPVAWEGLAAPAEPVPLDADDPTALAARQGRVVACQRCATTGARYPAAVVVAPIRLPGMVLGTVGVGFRDADRIRPAVVDLVEGFATAVASALAGVEWGRLGSPAVQRAVLERLATRAEALDALVGAVLDAASAATGADCLLVGDGGDGRLVARDGSGRRLALAPPHDGGDAWPLDAVEPVVLEAVGADPGAGARNAPPRLTGRPPCAAVVCMPIRADGEREGGDLLTAWIASDRAVSPQVVEAVRQHARLLGSLAAARVPLVPRRAAASDHGGSAPV
jgi:EAL domain-containing protein (putative c-di-GMP-specific phosphodiesterase class I)